MSPRKPYSEMTEDELQAYYIESQAYAEDMAREDLAGEIARGNFPEIRVRNGVASAKRVTPFDRMKANWKNR